jgi:hypothetical protein
MLFLFDGGFVRFDGEFEYLAYALQNGGNMCFFRMINAKYT